MIGPPANPRGRGHGRRLSIGAAWALDDFSRLAPAIFSKDPRANGLSKGAFVAVMNRLFAEQRIRVDTIGPPSRRIKTIVEWSPDASNSDD